MYGYTREQVRKRLIISVVLGVIIGIVFLIINVSQGLNADSKAVLLVMPLILILFVLEIFATIVCFKELWRPYVDCVLGMFKALVPAGAGGFSIPSAFMSFAKSFAYIMIAFIKAIYISIQLIIYVFKGE